MFSGSHKMLGVVASRQIPIGTQLATSFQIKAFREIWFRVDIEIGMA